MVFIQGPDVRSTTRKKKVQAEERLTTIGDVAREFGVTLRTLRFYEDRGLITPQRDGTSRLYRAVDTARLAHILKGKSLGFTLGEIRDMLAKRAAVDEREPLPLKPEQIQSQIRHLVRQRQSIDEAIGELSAALNA